MLDLRTLVYKSYLVSVGLVLSVSRESLIIARRHFTEREREKTVLREDNVVAKMRGDDLCFSAYTMLIKELISQTQSK